MLHKSISNGIIDDTIQLLLYPQRNQPSGLSLVNLHLTCSSAPIQQGTPPLLLQLQWCEWSFFAPPCCCAHPQSSGRRMAITVEVPNLRTIKHLLFKLLLTSLCTWPRCQAAAVTRDAPWRLCFKDLWKWRRAVACMSPPAPEKTVYGLAAAPINLNQVWTSARRYPSLWACGS